MEKESFENEEIAKIFNEYFICIKVDREEMPHLDSYYQRLYEKVKGKVGGWPLSVFMSSNQEPFYLATYIPPTKRSYHEGIDTLLEKLHKSYANDFSSIQESIHKIKTANVIEKKLLDTKDVNISTDTLTESFLKSYDGIYSGFGRHKKFPEAAKISLMMDIAVLTQDKELNDKSLAILDVMALRGLYDHIEGGFFRYAVDAAWEIPHFEKMLYNQAELIPLYVRAYKQTSNTLYKDIVIETITMLDEKFLSKNLYFSASDADTKGKEGEYFLFTSKEVRDALLNNPHAQELEESLEFTINGNFEGRVHLNFYTQTRPKGFNDFRNKLSKIRKKKDFPFIDKKINTAWNAMMIEALYSAAIIDPKYEKKADAHLESLKDFLFIKGELFHQSLLGVEPKQKGILEDYSFLISALLSGYEISFKREYLDFAEYLLLKAKSKFYKNGFWYLSDDGLHIKADLRDKYYTSALAKMTQSIIKLAALKASFAYDTLAQDTLKTMNLEIQTSQSNTPASAKAFLMQEYGLVTLKSSLDNLQGK